MKERIIRLPDGPVAAYRPRRKLPALAGIALATSALGLASCTTFGTNISGKFGCGAPQGGSCAPATVIDDKALAEITGDTSYRPAVEYRQAPVRPLPQNVSYAANTAVGAAPQKVLRIVFPAHVDGAGRYHEASVVQAMVDSGQWVAATNGHGPGLAASTTLNVSPEILSQLGAPIDAVTANERATAERLAADGAAASTPTAISSATPGAPSVAAVQAARAKAHAGRSVAPTAAAAGAKPVVVAGTPSAPAKPLASASPRVASNTPGNRPASFNPIVED